jgi:[acyl-carrier-protein] S-malonyltransferase
VAIAKDHGIKRAVLLPVSAPFHCPMMQPAADAMAEALAEPARRAAGAGLCQCHRRPVSDPDAIRDLLVQQVTGRCAGASRLRRCSTPGCMIM